MSSLNVLMCVYNESEYIDYSLRSVLGHVDNIVVVEGAYQEVIDLGFAPRSTDGTLEILEKYKNRDDVHILHANEKSDPHQRNVGLEKIKELESNDDDKWMLIVDGDEVWHLNSLKMVKIAAHNMNKTNKLAAYFRSMTFVNSFFEYCDQEFPRLFKVTQGCEFVNDNFLNWPDLGVNWFSPYVIKIPYIQYCHYSFCKSDKENFKRKKQWWESRFGDNFDYGWHINKNGRITDPNHEIKPFTGQHPEIMHSHPSFPRAM